MEFPGTNNGPPLIYGKSKVYFAKDCYGLMQQMGDRCDVKFSFKSNDPREVWEALAKRLQELNP